jgi:hypothetical protein
MLDRDDPAGGERAPIPDPVDFVDNRDRRIARAHKIAVQRMGVPVGINRFAGGHQCLANHLAAKNTLPAGVR